MRALTPDKKFSYAVACLSLVALLLLLLLPGKYIRWGAVAVLLLIGAAIIAFVKKRCILSYHKRIILLIMLIASVLYLSLYYLSGLYFGFGATLIKLSPSHILTYIIPIAAIILLSEYMRAALMGEDDRPVAAMAYLACVTTDILIAGGVRDITSSYKLTDFIGLTLFPAITSNILFNYVSKRYGMAPNIVYRMIITLYYYIIPFIPDAPGILPSFALLILPLAILALIDAAYERKIRVARKKKSKLRFVIPGIAVAFLVSFVMLISCKFRYGIYVIASPSMVDEINVGDAVVYEAYKYCDEAEVNDIVVFTSTANKRFVHRIIEIQTIDGQKRYITKGDANEDPDPGYITDENIVGVVHTKVLYIGYPSLWLHNAFK